MHVNNSTILCLFPYKNLAPVPLFLVKYSFSCYVYTILTWYKSTERWCSLVEEVVTTHLQ